MAKFANSYAFLRPSSISTGMDLSKADVAVLFDEAEFSPGIDFK